ncbi:MAG: flagellar protein FlaG [bacterium]|nr:flagellar protein FlaG [bacterium]
MADIQPINARPVAAVEESKPTEVEVAPERPVAEPAEESPVALSRETQEDIRQLDPAEQIEALERLSEALAEAGPPGWQVSIHKDEETGKVVVELKDENGETIKQFPPEKVLNLQRKIADLAGVVLDEAH